MIPKSKVLHDAGDQAAEKKTGGPRPPFLPSSSKSSLRRHRQRKRSGSARRTASLRRRLLPGSHVPARDLAHRRFKAHAPENARALLAVAPH